MADAFETILVAWLAFAFLPERPTRSQGGTDGSNPLSSTDESCSLGEKGVDDVIGRRTTPRPYRKYGMTSWANSVIDCFTSVGSISPPWLK